jgi:methylated-DNA-protein-cysteine methyltransferase-like protein
MRTFSKACFQLVTSPRILIAPVLLHNQTLQPLASCREGSFSVYCYFYAFPGIFFLRPPAFFLVSAFSSTMNPGGAPMSWARGYSLVKQIPRGRVLTYGQLGKLLALPGGARAAGRAMAASPSGQGIPWHRVLGAGGRILLREPHASLQRRLLESEGVRVAECRVDLSKHLWAAPRAGSAKSRKPRASIRK